MPRAASAAPGCPEPVLILSVETLPGLVDWRRPERLLELCRVAVVPRRGYDRPEPGWLEQHFPGRADRFQFLDGPDLGPLVVRHPGAGGARAAPSATWCPTPSRATSSRTGCMARMPQMGDDDRVTDEQLRP